MNGKSFVAFLCLVVLVNAVDLSSLTPSPVISTPVGSIQGLEGANFIAYQGIPYGQPPVGNLRFAPPLPAPAFSGVFNASTPGKACPQPAWEGLENEQSEDCLLLNVFTPKNSNGNLPVLFWIHGGGWEFGSGMVPLYWGNNLANDNTGIIVVTINYRLGALGYLTLPNLGAYNFGFSDQQLALRWVNQNIRAFGGDPSRVTIAGQSAGGISVATHVTTPSSFPYFSQAIVESGPPMLYYPTADERFSFGDQFANHLGCDSTNVTCLRTSPVESVLAAQSKIVPLPLPLPLITEPNAIIFWLPVIDGEIILDTPQTLINQNKTANVPMIWGTTRNETAGYVEALLPQFPISIEYTAILDLLFGRENATLVESMYPASTPKSINTQLSQLTGDYIFTCSVRWSLRAYTNAGNPTYKYVFLHPPSTDPRSNGSVSHCADIKQTCHGAELDYVFNTASYAGASFTSAEATLSSQILGYWTAFVNGTISQTNWQLYNPSLDNNIAFDIPSVYETSNWREQYCDFWDTWGYYAQ